MNEMVQGAVTVAVAIVGVAILAVIFGSQNTSSVIGAAGNAFSSVLKAAEGPVTGGGFSMPNLGANYPTAG